MYAFIRLKQGITVDVLCICNAKFAMCDLTVREEIRQDDSGKESGNRQAEKGTKKGLKY